MSVSTMRSEKSMGELAKAGGMAVAASVVINLLLYFLGEAIGVFPDTALTPLGLPITALPVILFSLIGAIVGTIGYIVLTRFLAQQRANLVFIAGIVIVELLMATSPFGIENVPTLQIVILEIMHIVVGVALYYFLVRRG